MRDIVGDLLQPLVQSADPGQHDVEIFRQAVELVAGAGHRQAPAEIAAHDPQARLGNVVDALQRAPADEEPDRQRAEPHHAERRHQRIAHDAAEAFGLAEIAADQHDHLIGQAGNDGDRGVRGLDGIGARRLGLTRRHSATPSP